MQSGCAELWAAIARLRAAVHAGEPALLALLVVRGLLCRPDRSGRLAASLRELDQLEPISSASVFEECCGAGSDARVYADVAAMKSGLVPASPGRAGAIRARVVQLLTGGHTVVLCGLSYGGLVVTRVAESLAADPCSANLYVRTFGSVYASAAYPRALHFVFDADAIATDLSGLRAPPIAGDALFEYDAARRVVWLRSMFPDARGMPRERRAAALSTIHRSYLGVLQLTATLFRTCTPDDTITLRGREFAASRALRTSLRRDWTRQRAAHETRALAGVMAAAARSYGRTGSLAVGGAQVRDALDAVLSDVLLGARRTVGPEPGLEALRDRAAHEDGLVLSDAEYAAVVESYWARQDGPDAELAGRMLGAVRGPWPRPFDGPLWAALGAPAPKN